MLHSRGESFLKYRASSELLVKCRSSEITRHVLLLALNEPGLRKGLYMRGVRLNRRYHRGADRIKFRSFLNLPPSSLSFPLHRFLKHPWQTALNAICILPFARRVQVHTLKLFAIANLYVTNTSRFRGTRRRSTNRDMFTYTAFHHANIPCTLMGLFIKSQYYHSRT